MLSAPTRTYLLWIHLTWTTFNHPVWTTSLCIPWPFCSALNWVYFPWLGLFPSAGSCSLNWVYFPWLGLAPLTGSISLDWVHFPWQGLARSISLGMAPFTGSISLDWSELHPFTIWSALYPFTIWPALHMRVEQKVLNRGLHCEGPGVCNYQSRLKFSWHGESIFLLAKDLAKV